MRQRPLAHFRLSELESREVPAAPPQAYLAPFASAARVASATVTAPTPNVQIADLAVAQGDKQHYSHIRVAMLAYTGTPLTDVERKLLRESVDLVVPSVRLLDDMERIAPNTPKLIYTNFTNMYGELLTDWLAYAERTGRNREGAFYHVNQATPFSGDSGSSKPVHWFWSIRTGRDGQWVDHTQVTKSSDPSFTMPSVGQAAVIGYPEEFREVNVQLRRGATGNWNGQLEYVAAVDRAGRPTMWRALTTRMETTRGWRQSGQITFDPPADWQPATIDGSDRLYYLRVRTVNGTGTPPSVQRLLGRDYVRANGTIHGTIPAFDTLADRNSDGYLSDSEYAQRRPGYEARFVYETRLFYTPYGQMRFATNPADGGYRAWSIDFARRFLAANPQADGLFLDNSYGRLQTSGSILRESTVRYAVDYASMIASVNAAIGNKWVLANTAGSGVDAKPLAERGLSFIEEFALRPMAHNHQHFRDTAALVAERLRLMGPNGYAILDTYPAGGSPTSPRMQLAALAYYYLLADPQQTFVMFNGGYEPSTSWQRHWTDAVKYDIGQPRGTWSTFATGADPENRALEYRIFQRSYDRALVLYKPLSYAKNRTGSTNDRTQTTHTLPGRYRLLNANGTLGPVITRLSLRNGEGAILVKA